MPTRFTRFFTLFAAALCATVHLQAGAGPMNDADAEKVRGVIVAQIAAFADDDAETAFQTATPEVRAAIGSSGRFLAMVRGAYPMVYRPASVSFHKPDADEGSVLQLVEITDGNAKSWLALFALEQQPDSSWRISGCLVAENHWQSV
ncbi:DUF4864 domain-containing protein [uncultured Ramlibacter sp.]|uniref:DUF4864 domain-containing protein n=1 Tax=uncultured Ramlibacter sp. TaxID=260755 RepID=UPI00261DF187|nr:DUF4864 domain-containing protein [uncultured Ramlibacter sp.]